MSPLFQHLVCILLISVLGSTAVTAQNLENFERKHSAWIEDTLWPQAQTAGVSRRTFDAVRKQMAVDWSLPGLILPGVKGNGPVDQHQSEFRAPGDYFDNGAMAQSASTGADMARRHGKALKRIERQTGVPHHILLAIWGRESLYGTAAIPHDAIRVLATRAYFDPRPDYFTAELIAALKLLDSGQVGRSQMKSSWGGALGQPQFMPTSALRYARDGDGDGDADIFSSSADVLASIAAYLAGHGWVAGRDWGFEVTLPATLSCTLEGQARTIAEWERMGVTRVSGRPFPAHEYAGIGYLVQPAGRFGPAFIVTPNFNVLKDYNNSDLYALYVGNLADRIGFGAGAFRTNWDRLDHLNRRQVARMQRALADDGHDVGGVDGLAGSKTRRAIGLWQEARGQPATCFPTMAAARALTRG